MNYTPTRVRMYSLRHDAHLTLSGLLRTVLGLYPIVSFLFGQKDRLKFDTRSWMSPYTCRKRYEFGAESQVTSMVG